MVCNNAPRFQIHCSMSDPRVTLSLDRPPVDGAPDLPVSTFWSESLWFPICRSLYSCWSPSVSVFLPSSWVSSIVDSCPCFLWFQLFSLAVGSRRTSWDLQAVRRPVLAQNRIGPISQKVDRDTVTGKHADPGKTWRQSVYLFILCISLMTKIGIEGKCCHVHSNHELKINTVILVQIIKHRDALFLREIYNMNKRIIYIFFLSLYPVSKQLNRNCLVKL
jgi:hypothetical protein